MLFLLVPAINVAARCNTYVIAGDAYTVNVDLEMVEVVINDDKCFTEGGYNYDIIIDYNVTFTGGSPVLYTLQGYAGCNDLYFNLPNEGGSGRLVSSGNAWANCAVAPSLANVGCSSIDLVIEGPGISSRSVTLDCDAPLDAEECFETFYAPDGTGILYVYYCDGVFTMPQDYDDVEVLIVAGGGGGGLGESAGGGGGGEVHYQASMMLNPGSSYQVAVGNGGKGALLSSEAGHNGGNSSFNNWVAKGGGGGGTSSSNSDIAKGKVGGNGGGGAADSGLSFDGGSGNGNAPSHSHAGGNGHQSGSSNNRAGGGGGGAGGMGNSGGNGHNPGDGGPGRQIDMFSGFPEVTIGNLFAAGGGATGRQNNGDKRYSVGGSGIGGDGNSNGEGGSGKENTGSGGGAGLTKGGKGADGVVVVKLGAKILPVVWGEINAELLTDQSGIQLNWTLLEELAVDHYVIERSIDGVQDFSEIGKVSVQDGARLSYQFKDIELPHLGERVYYRLRQVDVSGKHSYSKTVSVLLPSVKRTEGFWKVFPNPANGQEVSLVCKRKIDEVQAFKLIVYHSFHQSEEIVADSIDQLNSQLRYVLGSMASGIVVLEIRWENRKEYIKLML
ncbi:hypothetical protein KZP23_04235 [Echinicola marina]|uniref:glycine-rich domain-containing protein n=1 Tax=Echinicola marina TaxID=2859768 RepID=UPI001CF693A5|nr:hypothetical protein [Echinicola marina]UCS94248.1 hypothetical protein KZP23_04235 [Echinicola marina]